MIYELHDNFNMSKLITKLLGYRWQHECIIVPAYMPPYPRDDTKPSCVIQSGIHYLRHSRGPGTGVFWDSYGDDFLTVELALVELSKAPPPPGVSAIPTHGNIYVP